MEKIVEMFPDEFVKCVSRWNGVWCEGFLEGVKNPRLRALLERDYEDYDDSFINFMWEDPELVGSFPFEVKVDEDETPTEAGIREVGKLVGEMSENCGWIDEYIRRCESIGKGW